MYIIRLDKGLVILTGCGHAGVVNTMNYAKKITGINKIQKAKKEVVNEKLKESIQISRRYSMSTGK